MKFLAVTACPSGVAHTYMAAEAIANAAKKRGIDIKVETQGSIGVENKITESDVKGADAVILTKDMPIQNTERFKDIIVVSVGIGDCIKKADAIIAKVEEHVKNKKG